MFAAFPMIVINIAPNTAPLAVPIPPLVLAPPITAAPTISVTAVSAPMDADAAPIRAIYIIPASDARMPDKTYTERITLFLLCLQLVLDVVL